MRCCGLLAGFLCFASWLHAALAVMPGTRSLELKELLDVVMVDGLRRFCLRELAASPAKRAPFWQRDFENAKAYARSIAPDRARFREIIGAVDKRVTPAGNAGGFKEGPVMGTLLPVNGAGKVTIHAVRWPVIDGVTAEGLLLKPEIHIAAVVALRDAAWTPEQFTGLAGGLDNVRLPFRFLHRHLRWPEAR